MIDEHGLPNLDDRLLAAIRAVNPPVEKLMADRLALRLEVRRAKLELEAIDSQMNELRDFREIQIPRYIATAKIAALSVASILLTFLTIALFSGLFEIKITALLLASLILPLWLVDMAEHKFGRWYYDARSGMRFLPDGGKKFVFVHQLRCKFSRLFQKH